MALTFLSAILFYLSFPNCISIYGFWPCIWIFAVPLLMALHHKSWKKRLGLSVFWGLSAYGLMAQGLISISWAGFLGFVFALSIQAIFFGCCVRFSRWAWINPIYLSCLWFASEGVRNWILGGFSFYISHAQAFCPMMLKPYGIFGSWGMSLIIFFVNALIYAAVVDKPKRLSFGIAAGIVFLSVVFAGTIKQVPVMAKVHPLRISVIQANISPLEKMDASLFDRNVARHLLLTEQSFQQNHADLTIWPETAFPDDLLQSAQWRPIMMAQAVHMNADMLLGIAPIIDGREYNSALLINARGQVAGMYHKQALVPFAENTPLAGWGIKWGRGYHISPGQKSGLFTLGHGAVPFGVVICSESAHPSMVRQLRQQGARFIVEISNDGWFTDKASYMLHAQAAVMRAVENHVWVIRAANTGFSFAVDPNGVIHTDRNIKLGREGFGIFDIMVKDP
jgi:apolipoprotein N-acyltransferase